MKIQKLADAIVITSAVKASELDLLAQYHPAVLKAFDKETKEPVFAVAYCEERGIGCLSNSGIIFDDTDDEGYARTTVFYDLDTDAFAKEYYKGISIFMDMEDHLKAAAEECAEDFAAVAETIETIG